MLWNDFSEKPVRSRVSVVAGVPQTGWEAPREFPNLSGAKVLAIDTESYDPELLDNGAGWARNRSHMVGASIATDDGHSWYFPIRHSVCPEQNMAVEPVIRFLKDVLETPKTAKVGANLLYDVGMLQHEGVHVKGALWDVQYAEALLVEQGRVNLDHLASKYLGKHKETSLLYQWSQQSYGGDLNDQRANIHRCPPSLVGKYAEADASLPLEVFPHVWKELHKQGLHKLYRMECELIPLYVAMRYAGVRVDLEAAEILSHDLTQAYNTERFKLYDVAGFEVNVNSGDDLAKLFDSQRLHYPITETGKPSFVKDWLNQHEAPVAQQIVEVRKLLKLRDTFVDKIRSVNIDGKLYPQFHPLRGTGGGTRSGRYSSSGDLNVQQISSRDPLWSKRIRGLFVPDRDHSVIRKYDYQAIEYRFLAHFAVGEGADELRKAYTDNPNLDYHNVVMDMVAPVAGWDVSTPELKSKWRKPLKTINFGCIAEGGMVLTDVGLVPIQHVTLKMRVWDGAKFCAHGGVVYQGRKEVIQYAGLTATADHRVWCARSGRQIHFGEAAAKRTAITGAFRGVTPELCRLATTLKPTAGIPWKHQTVGLSCYSYLSEVWQSKPDSYPQPETHTRLSLLVYKVQRANKMGEVTVRQVLRNVPEVSPNYPRKRSQLPSTWYIQQVHVGAGVHNVGTGTLPERGVYGERHRQNRQRWGLHCWEYPCSNEIAKSTEPLKARTYDILNVGDKHRYTVNGVLVHNCVYGMGEGKLSRSLGLSHTEGKDFLKQYHSALPYAKATMKACSDFAESNGYIDTILGRRSRFEMFEPIDWADQNDKTPLPWRAAIGKYGYGNVRLTGLHKALNRRLQGCKPASARIWTDKGLPTIGESVGKQLNVWTGFNWAKAAVVPKGTWQMARVWLSTGEVIDCDTRHKFKLDNSDAWCAFEDLKLGDSVALPSLRPVVEWDGVVDVWYTLGYWLGDGWQGYSRSYDNRRDKWYTRESGRLVAADTKRDKLAEIFNYLNGERVNVHWTEKDRSGEGRKQLNWEINWSAQSACDYFKSIGVTHTDAHTKRIPESVWTANQQQQAAFLAGYLHADGSRKHAARGVVTVHSPNIALLREVQQLAHALGNEATFSKPSPTGSLLTVGAPRAYPYKLMHADFKASGGVISYSNAGVNRGIVAKRAVTKCRDTWQTNAERVYSEQKLGEVPYRFAYVTQIVITSEVAETYTLSVQDPRHQYIADGFVTKNSAADLLKKALHKCWTEGVFDSTGVPRLLIHDEAIFSVPEEHDREAFREMQHVFENALPLRVPILFEPETGTNWGNTKATEN